MTDDLGLALDRSVRGAVDELTLDPVLLLRGVQARQQGRTARWRTGGAALAAAAAVTAVALVVPVLKDRPPPAEQATVPTVPAGKQAVSWHGVEVLVPAEWTIGDVQCSSPASDTVLRPGIRLGCLGRTIPGLTVVEFHELTEDPRTLGAQLAETATNPVEVSGVPALRGTAPLPDEPGVQSVLVVPSEQVVVTVRSPDPARVEALLEDVRVVAVDAAGCRSRLPAAQPAGPSERAGAEAALVPGQPTAASLCEYSGLRLVASRRLEQEQVRALQRRLDGLPTGVSGRVPPDEIAADYCKRIDVDVQLLDVAYDQGPPVQVFVKPQGCTERSPTNGSTTRRLTAELSGALHALLAGRPVVNDLDRTQSRPQLAPELGYVQLPAGELPAQRADLLARTDGAADPQLLGAAAADGRLCLLLRRPATGAVRTLDCPTQDADRSAVTAYVARDDPRVILASAGERVRSVRVLREGKPVAVWATFGGGARHDQRRYVVGLLPSGDSGVELVGLDPAGNELARTRAVSAR